jgi:hypothetical protein
MVQQSWDFAKRVYEDEFEKWWGLVPKKVGKPRAQLLFKRLKGNEPETISIVIEWTRSYLRKVQSEKTEDRFILHPATILSQRRWEEEKTKEEPSRAEKEWEALINYVRRYGRYSSLPLPLSATGLEALRGAGGFNKLCNGTEAGANKMKIIFIDIYNG